MKLKLKKISTKSFVLIFSTINVATGLILGAIMTVTALLAPSEKEAGAGVWAILVFPIVNGLLGLAGGALLTALYNFFAGFLGGIEAEFENLES